MRSEAHRTYREDTSANDGLSYCLVTAFDVMWRNPRFSLSSLMLHLPSFLFCQLFSRSQKAFIQEILWQQSGIGLKKGSRALQMSFTKSKRDETPFDKHIYTSHAPLPGRNGWPPQPSSHCGLLPSVVTVTRAKLYNSCLNLSRPDIHSFNSCVGVEVFYWSEPWCHSFIFRPNQIRFLMSVPPP